MSTATVTSPVTQAFNLDRFEENAVLYARDVKIKRLVDALCGTCKDVRNEQQVSNSLAQAQEIITRLAEMSENGSGFTPPSGKGYGSDNAAVIAEKILQVGETAGAIRKSFAAHGKSLQ
jgi:hypothetical protein